MWACSNRPPTPGGAVKTGEYTLPGFRHDWGAMNLSLFAGSPFFKVHGAELQRHGLEFVPVTDTFCSAFPDGTWCGVSTDLAATSARIAALSVKDAETWGRLVSGFGAEAPHLFGLLGSPMRKRALAYFMLKTLRAKGLSGSAGPDPVPAVLTARMADADFRKRPQVRAMLAAWGMHLDFAPDVAGGALFPYLEGMAGQAFGMVLGKGGADDDHPRDGRGDRGARRACRMRRHRRPVILITAAGATGVELADGRKITAKRR